MAGIKQEIMSNTSEEDIVQIRKTDVAPMLTCMACNGSYKGAVKYCKNNHGVCSACLPGDKKQCPITGCGQNALVTLDFLSELVKDLKLPLPCKFKKDGCDKKSVDEEVIADHEVECGYRKVSCFCGGCPAQPAMELEAHLFSAHGYGIYRDNPGKWFLIGGNAKKMWIDSETGLRFEAFLYHDDKKEQWRCHTTVFAGKNVAKKFRAEMRLSSHDLDSSHIFNGNVYCLDDWEWFDASKQFRIDDDHFEFYNNGHIVLGARNRDKNGELKLPVTVDVKIKRLNVG